MANKSKTGQTFSFDLVEMVWEKAEIVPGFDPDYLRKDKCGAMIARAFYGECRPGLSLGWEIDHIKPLALGGTDELLNLQPLQWENNQHKSNFYPAWNCVVTVKGDGNNYINQTQKSNLFVLAKASQQ
jgi:hypothetical protein